MSSSRAIDRILAALAWATPPCVFCGVYGSSAGRGFISDDFRWILESRVTGASRLLGLFTRNNGFYRPLVSLTFALNHAVFGTNARGYGYTNLALALICAALLFRLCRALRLTTGAAAFAAAIWALNFHGINMAILWISGRTALLLVACSLAAAGELTHGRRWTTLGCVALALLSKEEAVLLPAILVVMAFSVPERPDLRRRRFLAPLTAGFALELLAYAVLRHHSGAMVPSSAPSYYRFVFAPAAVARNAAEYLDRACTFAAAASILAWAILRRPSLSNTRDARPSVLVIGAAWFVCGYAITVFLPVRSSLYACLPSVGAAIVAAEFCGSRWQISDDRRRRIGLAVLTSVAVALAPIYVARTHRWTDLATFSTMVLRQLTPQLEHVEPPTYVVLIDRDRGERANLQSAFGTLIVDAIRLRTGKDLSVWVDPPFAMGSSGMSAPCSACRREVFVVSGTTVMKAATSRD